MANEFVARNGIIAKDNSTITGTLAVSGNITMGGVIVATRTWVTGTALTGYATESYVTTAISNLIDSAPGALNTLNELAAALGDDPNFATTITNSIGTKLSLGGGTMTGNIGFNTTGTGLSWSMNTDGAYIMFFNTGDGDTNSRLEYGTSDNGNEFHRWMVSTAEEMTLKSDGLRVTDSIWMGGNLVATQSWVTSQNYLTTIPAEYLTQTEGDALYAPISHTHAATDITSGTLAAARLSGNYAINVTGSAATLTTARTLTIGNTGKTFNGGGDVAWTLAEIGAYAATNPSGYITSSGNTSGYSGTLLAEDNRTISPSELTAVRLKFGFTSWANNNTAPYADFLHLRSYTDASGGLDNLVVFRKDAIGMRIYQQTFGSTTAYSTFKDVAFTDSSITGNAATATTLQTARTLTIGNTGKTFNGSANVSWSLAEIGAQAALTNPVTGTGTTNYLPKFTGSTTLGNSQIFDNGTNVGIGTTSPSYKLQVYNSSNGTTAAFGGTTYGIRIDNGGTFSSGRSTIYGVDSTFYGSYQPLGIGASEIYFNISGTDRVIINSSGNVGIGTTAPGSKLHVFDGTNTVVTIQAGNQPSVQLNTTDGLANAELFNSYGNVGLVGNLTSSNYIMYHYGGAGTLANQYTYFQTAGVERMRITGAGNVGIGTTSPLQKLDVNGNISLGSWTKPGSTYVGLRRADDGSFGGGGDSGLVIESYNHAAPYTGDYSQRVHLRTHLYNGGSHNVLTAYGTNVGVGIDTPTEKLHVVGRARITTIDNGTGDFATISGTGVITRRTATQVLSDIGAQPSGSYLTAEADTLQTVTSRGSSTNTDIRIKRPSNKVDNASCTELPSRVEFNNAFVAGSTGYTIFTYPTSSVFRIYGDYDGNLGGVQPDIQLGLGYLTVKSAGGTIGNVGIGTASPLFNLQVGANAGTVAATTIRLQNSYLDTNGSYGFNIDAVDNGVSGHDLRFLGRSSPTGGFSELVRVKNTGNVGIGTSSPGTKLDVNGVITATGGNSTNWNTAYGWGNHASAGYGLSTGDITAVGLTASTLTLTRAAGNLTSAVPTFNQNTTGSAATLTTARTLTIGATGKTFNGSANVAWTLAEIGALGATAKAADSELLDGIDSSGFVRQLADTNTPNYQNPSSRRVDPNALNPTNEHYAVTTFGNGSNVTGQLATHFQTGNLYSRGYNSTWSAWRRYWNDTDFTSTNISNWNTAFGWGNHASAGYAPLASPGLTGTPTAPTATAGTNTTQIATTAFVQTAVSNLVDAAPATLDTLNELAAALGDDPNFATTVSTNIGTKVSKAGDTVTGKITFPSAVSNRPQFPGGILGLDTGDGNFDIWGISRDYYPSNATAANAWGLRWNGDNNDFEFVGGGTNRVILDMDSGNLTVGGTITENSSIRYKENIVDLEFATEKVEQLRPVRYNKIETEQEEIGLIAEEVAEIYPEVVTYNEEGQPDGVNYTRLSVILLKSVQELAERINKLENK